MILKVLIIGGSNFLGYHIAEAALTRGHELSLFNRGQSNPGAFPQAETLVGDRDGDLAPLRGRQWDVVIDTCGYVPRIVRKTAELFQDTGAYYHFVSTISVYPESEYSRPVLDEDSPTIILDDPQTEAVTGETYGGLKALCEGVVQALYGERCSITRPGLIVGPRDFTDRFTYWPRRVAQGGVVLAPGESTAPVQVIDARDLAAFILDLAEARQPGLYNAVGPGQGTTWGQMLETCRAATGNQAEFLWMDEAFLLENEVVPFADLPLWVPASLGGVHRIRNERALAVGLQHRPLTETIRDLLAWDAGRAGENTHPRANQALSPERESELIRLWESQAGS
jgi:2'-hydroxyisoflavone reductase